jgi:hypothetical protein
MTIGAGATFLARNTISGSRIRNLYCVLWRCLRGARNTKLQCGSFNDFANYTEISKKELDGLISQFREAIELLDECYGNKALNRPWFSGGRFV